MSAKPLGYYQDATVSAATSLAGIVGAAVPAEATFAYVQCEAQACRWRDDGVDPTASVGMTLAVGVVLTILSSQFNGFRIIEAAGSAKVNVQFYK